MANNKGTPRVQYRCSFCGKSQEQVHRLIAGPGGVYICDECIDLCTEIVDEESFRSVEDIELIRQHIAEKYPEGVPTRCTLCDQPLEKGTRLVIATHEGAFDREERE